MIGKIETRRARVAVVGLGYVGLPLAVEFADAGFDVVGIEVDRQKLLQIRDGQSYIPDIPSERLLCLARQGKLTATDDPSALRQVDAVSICVPTPLRKTKDPDISYIVDVAGQLKKYVHPEMLVVLESTSYPGTTREIVLPAIDGHPLQVGRDLFLAFSPERVDPGNKRYNTRNTPKVIGGITPSCTRVACSLYSQAIEQVVAVNSAEAAEMVKLLENTFRAVNIALVNEVAMICNKLGLDVWEVIDAAATKPFGYMKFYPGPGIGGHCIPVDPHYLSWKLRALNYTARFIDLAGEVNSQMPSYVVDRLIEALNMRRKSVNGSRILIIGVAYKPDVSDTRESPALDIIRLLQRMRAEVIYHDPFVPALKLDGEELSSVSLDQGPQSCDCAVIITNHSGLDYQAIYDGAPLIVDTRNALSRIKDVEGKLFKL